jgi:hypothetical protein
MGFADFPIEAFKKVKKEHDFRKEKVKGETQSSGDDTPPASSSRSQSQLDLSSQESAVASDASSRHGSESTATPKTSSEETIRSSIDVPDTPLSNVSSELRGNSLKQALRGTLGRSGSRSGSRDRSSLSRSNSKDRKPGSRSSSPFRHRRSNTAEFDPSKLTIDNVTRAGKGVSRIVGAGLKSPMDFTLGIARGFHNAPKLYGDDTVRPQAKVTDLQSGLKAAGKASTPNIRRAQHC